jgi:ComF family protein
MKFNIRYFLDRLVNPGACLLCGLPAGTRQNLCIHCWRSLPRVPHPCRLCGLPSPGGDPVCPRCLHRPPPWQRMRAPLVFSGETRRLLLQMKFEERLSIANTLASRLWPLLAESAVEAMIPVPLHPRRLLERGFNQSLLIARHLGWRLDLPVDHRSLIRHQPTRAQTGLSRNQRRKNLRRAFAYRPHKPWRRIALIDDVITTGSTMEACCSALKQGGVESVEVWSIARTLKQQD